jgi:hypothetical protein
MADDVSAGGYADALGPGALEGAKRLMTDAGKEMLKEAPNATRYVLRKVPGAPGFIYDAATFATSKDKLRTGLGMAGGGLGGMAGGAIGGPVGAALGSAAGEAGTEWVYDHRDELARKAADTAQWMKARTAQAAGVLTHGFDQGLPPYATPMR